MAEPRSMPAGLRGAVDLSSLVNRPQNGAPAGAAANGAAASEGTPLVQALSQQNLQAVVELSQNVPVIVDIAAPSFDASVQLSASLDAVVTSYAGRFVLVRVDADADPQLAGAFQAQTVPTVAALIGGRPMALFEGQVPSEEQIRGILEQVLQVAAQNGVTGQVTPANAEESAEEQAEPPLPPRHQAAYDALARGDFESAIAEYTAQLAESPADDMARAGLAQVQLLQRLSGREANAIREAAASAPDSVPAQLEVADLDVSGGHLDDAFDRLLSLFPRLDADGKKVVRERLLDYFLLTGDDPRVTTARRRLTNLLY